MNIPDVGVGMVLGIALTLGAQWSYSVLAMRRLAGTRAQMTSPVPGLGDSTAPTHKPHSSSLGVSSCTLPELADLANLLENGGSDEQVRQAVRALAETESPEAVHLQAWFTWLCDRPQSLAGLGEHDLIERFTVWRDKLDRYVHTNPETLQDLGLVRSLAPATQQNLVDRLRQRQQDVLNVLATAELSRIEANTGSAFVTGLVEPSDLVKEPATDPTLIDKVCRIEPGSGGYRYRGRILMPSVAVPYARPGGSR